MPRRAQPCWPPEWSRAWKPATFAWRQFFRMPMTTNRLNSVDDYIALQPGPAQAVLERVRRAIRKGVPRAGEVISYNMPTFKLNGQAVLHLAGWKRHWSLYPC